jgi:hypothetical protein
MPYLGRFFPGFPPRSSGFDPSLCGNCGGQSDTVAGFLGVLQFPLSLIPPTAPHYIRFEVFTAVTMKNGVFLDVTPCSFCKDRRFGGT